MRLLAGRDISDTDTPTSPLVAVVNETFARTFVPGGAPLGRRFWVEATSVHVARAAATRSSAWSPTRSTAACAKSRGRWRSSRSAQRGGTRAGGSSWCERPPTLQAFTPALRDALARVQPNLRFVVRTLDDGDPRLAAARSRDGDALVALRPARRAARRGRAPRRRLYAVERRRREIGIRLALGASRGAIVRSVLRESGLLVGTGLALGVVLSLGLTGAARTLLFGLEPRDAGTIAVAVTGADASSRSTASLLPAQRAARVDPMSTLKDE